MDNQPVQYHSMEKAEMIIQKDLITVSTDKELKQKFNQCYQKFWLQRYIEILCYKTLVKNLICEKFIIMIQLMLFINNK